MVIWAMGRIAGCCWSETQSIKADAGCNPQLQVQTHCAAANFTCGPPAPPRTGPSIVIVTVYGLFMRDFGLWTLDSGLFRLQASVRATPNTIAARRHGRAAVCS